jgi:PTH1 family peptidyl-tRNA hydrolase
MILIVGLGNPGTEYKNTRHNIGARIVDELRSSSRFANARVNKEVVLAGPQTYMNESGKYVKLLIKRYKLNASNLVVIHDDIDLPLGIIKIVKNRGAAGHKGIESIMKELGTKNFIRFRIGINHGSVYNAKTFVIQRFTKEEEIILKEVIEKTIEAVEMMAQEGPEKTMNAYNK